jgi:hypothetical protein
MAATVADASTAAATHLDLGGTLNKESYLARGLLRPLSTFAQLQERCPNLGQLNVLLVPKTGSTSMGEMVKVACKRLEAPHIRVWSSHEVVPSDTCHTASVAMLRDPCERLPSMYRHFEILWSLHRNARLNRHWVQQAPNADVFVSLLRTHWQEVMGNKILPFVVNNGTVPKVGSSFWLSAQKHDVTLMPQALWIGNLTVVLCVTRFEEEVSALFSAVGCKPMVERYTNHEVNASSDKYILSPAGCRATQALFSHDAELWDRHCAHGLRSKRLHDIPPVRHPTVPFERGVFEKGQSG